jgi:transposase
MRRAPTIVLNTDTREELEQLARSRSQPQRLIQRAQIILRAAAGLDNDAIGAELNISRQKAGRWRSRFVERGMDGILNEEPGRGRPRSIGPRKRAAIVRTTLEQKPDNATQWSRTSMSAEAGVSPSTIGRIWKEHGLKPHLIKTFKLSNDKRFAEKLEDVVGLYLNPPENAIVLSCDEKSQMQALDRTQPGLPMKKGRCGTMTHDYKRNGTTTLFAALNTIDGAVLETCMPRHRHQEWIRFLNLIQRNTPSEKEIHIICDNYATHKHAKVQ